MSLLTVAPAPSQTRHLFPAPESRQHDCVNSSSKFCNPGGGTGKDKFSVPLSTGVFLRDEPNVFPEIWVSRADLGAALSDPPWKPWGLGSSRASPSGAHPRRPCNSRWAHLKSRVGPCRRPRRPSATVTRLSSSPRWPTDCRAADSFLLTSGAWIEGRSCRDLHTGRACPACAPPRPRLLNRAIGAGAQPGSCRVRAVLQPIAAPGALGGAAARRRSQRSQPDPALTCAHLVTVLLTDLSVLSPLRRGNSPWMPSSNQERFP